jgi:hypothetical protein
MLRVPGPERSQQMTMRTRGQRIALGAFALAVVALLTASTSQAAAKKSSGTPCWKLVVNDWFDNGRIDGTYPIPCYTQAIQHIPEDARVYSSAPNDIRRAMLAAIRQDSGGGHGAGGHSGSDIFNGPGGNPYGPGPGSSASATPHHRSLFTRLADSIGPSNASSIPLPLLVLGGVALLLLAAAAMSFLTRRIQARRVQVAPAPAPQPPKHT